MHGNLPASGGNAIEPYGTSAARKPTYGKSAADDGEWFSEAAQRLHEHKPGTQLHYLTGLGDERLCQKYAAGSVKPPAYFLRALLRGENGYTWLAALMDGSDAQWWRELDAARSLLIKFKVEQR